MFGSYDYTFDSAANVWRIGIYPHLILSRYNEGLITNDTKWLQVPLFAWAELEYPFVQENPMHKDRATNKFHNRISTK